MIDEAVPASIRMSEPLALPPALSEVEVVDELRAIAAKNRPMVQMIGLGYYDTFTPAVIQRRVLENPGWYTAYTPYQPEISQGRLEALLNFQTMVEDLTGLPTANASLLDEATAAAEAMTMAVRASSGSQVIVVDSDVFPQTIGSPADPGSSARHRRAGAPPTRARGCPPVTSRVWCCSTPQAAVSCTTRSRGLLPRTSAGRRPSWWPTCSR